MVSGVTRRLKLRSARVALPARLWRTTNVAPTELSRNMLKRKCLSQLLGSPLRSRMRSHVEMDNAPAFVKQHKKDGDLKANGRYAKEVHRHQGLEVIV
jgi:hypothetical protein